MPPRVAEFVHFAHAIGRVDFDRDLVGKIAINLSLRNLTFASDHRRQRVKSEARNGPLTPHAATTRATRYIYAAQRIPKRRWRFVVSLQKCEPPSMWANTSLDGGKSLVSAAAEVLTETISTTFTNPIRVMSNNGLPSATAIKLLYKPAVLGFGGATTARVFPCKMGRSRRTGLQPMRHGDEGCHT